MADYRPSIGFARGQARRVAPAPPPPPRDVEDCEWEESDEGSQADDPRGDSGLVQHAGEVPDVATADEPGGPRGAGGVYPDPAAVAACLDRYRAAFRGCAAFWNSRPSDRGFRRLSGTLNSLLLIARSGQMDAVETCHEALRHIIAQECL